MILCDPPAILPAALRSPCDPPCERGAILCDPPAIIGEQSPHTPLPDRRPAFGPWGPRRLRPATAERPCTKSTRRTFTRASPQRSQLLDREARASETDKHDDKQAVGEHLIQAASAITLALADSRPRPSLGHGCAWRFADPGASAPAVTVTLWS